MKALPEGLKPYLRYRFWITPSVIVLLLLTGYLIHRTQRSPQTTLAPLASPGAPNEVQLNGKPQQAPAGTSSDGSSSATGTDTAAPAKTACSILTLQVAESGLGTNDLRLAADDAQQESTSEIAASGCTYKTQDESGMMRLTMRRPLTALGRTSNAVQFGSGRPSGSESVPGYGQAAYWDAGQSTLHILAGNTWYSLSIVRSGVLADLSSTRQAADGIDAAL